MPPAVVACTRSASLLIRWKLTGSKLIQAPPLPTITSSPPAGSRPGATVAFADLASKNSAWRSLGKTSVVSEPVSGLAPPAPPSSV